FTLYIVSPSSYNKNGGPWPPVVCVYSPPPRLFALPGRCMLRGSTLLFYHGKVRLSINFKEFFKHDHALYTVKGQPPQIVIGEHFGVLYIAALFVCWAVCVSFILERGTAHIKRHRPQTIHKQSTHFDVRLPSAYIFGLYHFQSIISKLIIKGHVQKFLCPAAAGLLQVFHQRRLPPLVNHLFGLEIHKTNPGICDSVFFPGSHKFFKDRH